MLCHAVDTSQILKCISFDDEIIMQYNFIYGISESYVPKDIMDDKRPRINYQIGELPIGLSATNGTEPNTYIAFLIAYEMLIPPSLQAARTSFLRSAILNCRLPLT